MADIKKNISTEFLTDNHYLKYNDENRKESEGSSRNGLIAASAKGTAENDYLDPVPILNKLGQIYSNLTSEFISYSSARSDSIKMNRFQMDYTNDGQAEKFQTDNYWFGVDFNGDGQVGIDDATLVLNYYAKSEVMGDFNKLWFLNSTDQEKEEIFDIIFPFSTNTYNQSEFDIFDTINCPEKIHYYSRNAVYLSDGEYSYFLDSTSGHNGNKCGIYDRDYSQGSTKIEIMNILASKIFVLYKYAKDSNPFVPDEDLPIIDADLASQILKTIVVYAQNDFASIHYNEAPQKLIGGDFSCVNLLMPRYGRRVEVEDLDENFWVIGQTTDALVSAIWKRNGLLDITTDIIDNINDLQAQTKDINKTINFISQFLGLDDVSTIDFCNNEISNKAYNLFENIHISDFQIKIGGSFGSRFINAGLMHDNHPCIPEGALSNEAKQIIQNNGSIQELFDELAKTECTYIDSACLLRASNNENECIAKYYYDNLSIIGNELAQLPYKENDSFVSGKFFRFPQNFNIIIYDGKTYKYDESSKRIMFKASSSEPNEGFKTFVENFDNYTLFQDENGTAVSRYPTLFIKRPDAFNSEIICIGFRDLCIQLCTPLASDLNNVYWTSNILSFYKTSFQISTPDSSGVEHLELKNNAIRLMYFNKDRQILFGNGAATSGFITSYFPVAALTGESSNIQKNTSFVLDEQVVGQVANPNDPDIPFKTCSIVPRMCGSSTERYACYATNPHMKYTGVHSQIAEEFLSYNGQQYMSAGGMSYTAQAVDDLFTTTIPTRYNSSEKIPQNFLTICSSQGVGDQAIVNACYSLLDQQKIDRQAGKAPYGIAYYKANAQPFLRAIKINGIAFNKEADSYHASAPMAVILSTPVQSADSDDWNVIETDFVPNDAKFDSTKSVAGPAFRNFVDYNGITTEEPWCSKSINDSNYRKEFLFEFDCKINQDTGFKGLGNNTLSYLPRMIHLVMCGETQSGGPIPTAINN